MGRYNVRGEGGLQLNASLERAQAKLIARRAVKSFTSTRRPATQLHEPLQVAYVFTSYAVLALPLHLLVRYCPRCMHGLTSDLVRELPDETPSAHDLGVKMVKQWQLQCQNT